MHNHKRCPLLLLGHAGGLLKGNMHVRAADGTPMADAMLAMLQGLGVAVDTFGDSAAVMDLNRRRASRRRWRLMSDSRILGARLIGCWSSPLCADAALEAASDATVADAARLGDVTAVKALLKSGADVNAAQGDGMTALHWAAQKGDTELVGMLLVGGRQRAGDDPPWRLHAAPSGEPGRPRRASWRRCSRPGRRLTSGRRPAPRR